MSEPPSTPSTPGLLGSLKRLGRTAVSAVETRVELLGTDLERERLRLAKLLVWGAASLSFLLVGLALLALLAVALAGEEHRILVLAVLSGLFLLVGLGGALGLRAWLQRQPKPFHATLSELRRDREQIS